MNYTIKLEPDLQCNDGELIRHKIYKNMYCKSLYLSSVDKIENYEILDEETVLKESEEYEKNH